MSPDEEDVRVVDSPDRNRFEITVGGQPVGFAAYRRHGDTVVFTHTEVDSAVEGEGLGSQLVRSALGAVRDQGLSVVPRCPFVASWIEHHPDYADLVASDDAQE